MADITINGSVGPTAWQRQTIRRLEDQFGPSAFAPWVVHEGGYITSTRAGRRDFFTLLPSGKVRQLPESPVWTEEELVSSRTIRIFRLHSRNRWLRVMPYKLRRWPIIDLPTPKFNVLTIF